MILFIINILILVGLLILGTPLPYAFGGAVIFMVIFGDVPIISIILWGFNQLVSSSLLAVPLFILFGSIVSKVESRTGYLDLLIYSSGK